MKYYDGVVQRVKKLEEKNAIFYAKPDGKLYNAFKFIYIAVFIYGGFNVLAYLLGIFIRYKERLSEFAVDILTSGVCLVLILAGCVLLLKKIHIAGAALNTAPAVLLIFFFRERLLDEYTIDSVYPKYYWRHLAPMLLVIICSVLMCAIAVRAHLKFKSQYTRVTENLYNLYKINAANGEDVSEEQWEEFLEKYDPFSYKPQFLKNMKTEDQSEGQSDT